MKTMKQLTIKLDAIEMMKRLDYAGLTAQQLALRYAVIDAENGGEIEWSKLDGLVNELFSVWGHLPPSPYDRVAVTHTLAS